MTVLPLPTSPVEQTAAHPLDRRIFGLRVRTSCIPRQSRGRAFLRRTAPAAIISPHGFVVRALHFGEDEPVSRDTALNNARVRTALNELGADPAAVEIID
jgi:hypothetical protein